MATQDLLTPDRRAATWSDLKQAWRDPKRVRSLIGVAKRTRLGRSLQRFFNQQGPLLSAGIAYMSLFSLTAAITVGWTAFSTLLGDNTRLRDAVLDASNQALPGLFITEHNPNGLVDPDTLVASPGISLTGLFALLVALFAATSVVKSLARAMRAMFGIGNLQEPLPAVLLHRVVGLLTLFVGVLSIAVLTSLGTFLHQLVVEWLGDSTSQWLRPLFNLLVVLVPFLVDFFVFVVFVRFVAGVLPGPWDLIQGGIIAATGSLLLRLLGTSILTQVSGPILATATTLITLIVWVNLLAWVMLLAAAWTANPPGPVVAAVKGNTVIPGRPNYVTLSHPETLRWLPEIMHKLPPDVAVPTTIDDIEPSPEHDPKSAHPKSEPETQ